MVIVFDGKGGSVKRRDLYADYKAGRKINTKFNRPDHLEINVEQEMMNMRNQLSRLSQYLDTLPITILSIDNVEADDIIAYMTTNVFHESRKVTIMSDDKDFLQLINDKVSVWRPVTKLTYTEQSVFDRFGVPAYNYILLKLFIGDSSDNIKGVDGIAAKTLCKYIPEITTDKLTLDDIIKIAYERNHDAKVKVYQNILDNEKLLRLNYELMQLADVDIPGNVKSITRDILMNQEIPPIDRFQFKRLLAEDRAYNVFKDPDGWLLDSFNYLAGYASMRNEKK